MKHLYSKIAIAIVLFTAFLIDIDFKNWEKKERVIEWDVHWYYAYLPAQFIYDDIKLEKNSYLYGDNLYWIWAVPTPEGKFIIKSTMGLSFMYAPFFFVAHVFTQLSEYPANGFSESYKFFLLLSSIFYLGIGLDFLRKILTKYKFSEGHIAITILLIGIGTNLLCYSSQSATMAHSYGFCLFAIFFYYTIKWHEKQTLKNIIILGLTLGLITLIRPANIVLALFFVLFNVSNFDGLKQNWILFRRNIFGISLMALAFVLVWIPQFIYWKITTGSYMFYSYNNEHFFFDNPQIIDGLFSFRKGWLVYTPMMAFALIGFFFMKEEAKKIRFSIITFFVVNIYIIFSWWCWWYGGTFGQRSLIESYAILALPLASFIKYLSEQKRIYNIVFYCLAGFFIWLNIFQTYQFEYHSLHHDGMTKTLYLKQFGKLDRIEGYYNYVNWADYEGAMVGRR